MDLFDLIFPKFCIECKSPSKYICTNCVNKVLDGSFDEENFSIFKYKGVIKKAIVLLKYKFATDVACELIENMSSRLKVMKHHNVSLVPVPLHKFRQNWRGFNQSIILGNMITEKMNWNFLPDLILKQKNTSMQANLRRVERKTNLKDAFLINPNIDLSKIKNMKILIFDDVYTTGSTILEIKKVLKQAGFKNVYSLTIAR